MATENYVISLSPEEVAVALCQYVWGEAKPLLSKLKLGEDGAELSIALNQPLNGKEVELTKRNGFYAPRLALVRRK